MKTNKFGVWASFLGSLEFEFEGEQYVLAVGYSDDLPTSIYFRLFKDGVNMYSRYIVNGTLDSAANIPAGLVKKCLDYVRRLQNLKAFL